MPKIVQLSAHVADLIAAGEVVERPASVVKELLENSIDAGATVITAEIQNGGMTYLRVTDNGCGIAPEDAETAFLRHATSKIRKKEDLECIGTLGFRGEALAATAAVSRIDLLTCQPGAPEGIRLHLEGGRVTEREPAGCPAGTTLIVRDLFYNTPARMKFMKRDTTEASAVLSVVQKQALAHTDISFRLLKDGEEVLHSPGDGQLESAVYSVLGRQTAMEMVPVVGSWEKIKVTGCVSKPTATRGNRNTQLFFVNGRYVKSKTMTAALEEAYRNRMMTGRYPSCVLYVELPLSMVDVNVHPAKTEVKFLNEHDLFDCVHYGVRAALDRAPGKAEMTVKEPKSGAAEPPKTVKEPSLAQPKAPASGQPRKNPEFYRTMTAEEYKTFLAAAAQGKPVTPGDAALRAVFGGEKKPAVHDTVQVPRPAGPKLPELPAEKPAPAKAPRPETPAPAKTPARGENPAPAPETEPEQQELPVKTQSWRYIGETMRTYILVEQGEELLMIDKHAAHERILFEKFRAQKQEIMSQLLLTPLTCELAPEDTARLTEHRELLLSLGYDLDDAGDGAVLVRSIPADIAPEDTAALLAELSEKLAVSKKETPQTVRDELLHTMACKAAVKAGWITSPEELQAIAREVLSRDDLKYCPHGRPICVSLSRKQLEKQFKRT